jgi:hypothetical protein
MRSRLSLYFRCIIVCSALLLFSGCEQNLWIEVSLGEDHPWEVSSGRRFWYTVIYQGLHGVEQQQLSIGVRTFRLLVPSSSTCIIAAFPLGQGIPFGGAYQAQSSGRTVTLELCDGLLAKTLLQVAQNWPEPVQTVNFYRLAKEVSYIDSRGIAIDWNRLAKDLVSGGLDSDSLKQSNMMHIEISDLIGGHWIAESPWITSFYAFSSMVSGIGELPPGIFRYINLAAKVELRLVVPDDDSQQVFWHLVPLDALLRISDAVYQKLLEDDGDFP